MTHADGGSGDDPLAEARATIVRQDEEIARLRRRLGDERLAEDLREALVLAAATGTIASPVTHARLLELIVETAADVIGARAGALFLVDEAAAELTFQVAIGPKAAEVKQFRVPLGHGIAGLVAVSGQPMTIGNVGADPRHAADIARGVGYHPESILCVPLFYGDRVTGVLELLDKEGASTFSAADMRTLGLFANQAAVAIEQSRTHRSLTALLDEVLRSPSGAAGGPAPTLGERTRQFAARVETEDIVAGRALDLALLVQEIVWRGDPEREACRTILLAFATYLRQRPDWAALGTGP
jgi:GAF domain-containing protein